MTLSRYTFLAAVAAASLTAQHAAALSEDDKSMSGSDASARYSDPDEKLPAGGVMISPTSSNHLQGGKESGSASGSVDPSTVRYEYDKDSGTYTPRNQ